VTWPTIYVEAAFDAWPYDGVDTWTWTDVTASCPGFTISSPSRERFTDGFNPGTATFTLDNSGRLFDPFATSGTYTSGGVSLVRPNLPIRVRAVYSATTYYLWTGYVDTIDVQWNDPGDSVAVLSATDGFKILAARLTNANFDPETSFERASNCVSGDAWYYADRDIGAAGTRLAARTPPDDTSVLDELRFTADHEHGLVYMNGRGYVTFRGRSWPYTSTVWTLSDAGGGALEYTDLTLRSDTTSLINSSRHGNAWSEVRTSAENTTSMNKYGRVHAERTDWEYEWDTEPAAWAPVVVNLYGEQVNRFATMTTNPTVDDALWSMTLSAELYQRASVTRTPPGGGSATTRACFLSGWTHTVTSLGTDTQGSWETVWKLEDASSWPTYTPAKWGTAKWGTADWFY
jgi:hypothetical protein